MKARRYTFRHGGKVQGISRRRYFLATGVSLSIVLSSATALIGISPSGASSASSSTSASQGLKRGLAYYRGKTMTFVDPGSVGGYLDLLCRAIAPAMAIYLHATVNVEDNPAANTIAAEDAIAASNPNGLTIGLFTAAPEIDDILLGAAGLNFNPEREAFLGETGAPISAYYASATSPITSFAQINTQATPPGFLAVATGSTNLAPRVLFGALGFKVNFITGYTSTSAQLTGFIRGDGPLVTGALAQYASLIVAGTARPLLITGTDTVSSIPAYLKKYFKGVPTLVQYTAKYPPKTKAGKLALAASSALQSFGPDFIAPSKTGGPELAALRAAMEFSLKNAAVKAKEVLDGVAPLYRSGAQAKANYITVYEGRTAMSSFATYAG